MASKILEQRDGYNIELQACGVSISIRLIESDAPPRGPFDPYSPPYFHCEQNVASIRAAVQKAHAWIESKKLLDIATAKMWREIHEEERLTADFVNNFELPKEAEDAADTGTA